MLGWVIRRARLGSLSVSRVCIVIRAIVAISLCSASTRTGGSVASVRRLSLRPFMNSLLTGKVLFNSLDLSFNSRGAYCRPLDIYIARTLVQQAVTVMKENGVEQVRFLHYLSIYPSVHLNRVLSPRYL